MAILKIARMGHPVLRRRADPVTDPTAPTIVRLIGDMIDTLEDSGGLGLAAPQVHVPLRLVIFHVPGGRTVAGEAPLPLTVLINPVIEPMDEDRSLGWEGCLSISGLRGVVPRYRHIRYSGLDADGRRVLREASDIHARVVQHECDHLDGILYPSRMADHSLLTFESEMKHFAVVTGEVEAEAEGAE